MFKKKQEVWLEINDKKVIGVVTDVEKRKGFKGMTYHVVYVKLNSGETIAANEWMVHPMIHE